MRTGLGEAMLMAGAVILLSATSVKADENDVKVLRTIPFSSDAKVRQTVIDQCGLQTELPQFLDENSDRVELVDDLPGKGARILELTITDVRAAGGGWVSGPKWITVEGVLRENGREIGNFTAKRITIGYLQFTACSSARRCAKAIGKDIAEWLVNPQPGSRLGSA